MLETYAHLTGHRSWWVPDFSVWGETGTATVDLLADEIDGSTRRIMYFNFPLGGAVQDVVYDELLDHRRNGLPASIDHPLIVVIPKSSTAVSIIGRPSSNSFKIARTQTTTENALVDLWIVEMGA